MGVVGEEGRGRGSKEREPIQERGINDGELPQGPSTRRLASHGTGCAVRFRLKGKKRLAYPEELTQSASLRLHHAEHARPCPETLGHVDATELTNP